MSQNDVFNPNANQVKYSKKEAEVLAKKEDPVAHFLNLSFAVITKNAKVIFSLVGLFVLGGLAYGINDSMANKKEAQLQEQYAQAEKEQLEKERGFEEAERGLGAEGEKKADAKKQVRSTGDLEKDHGSSVKIYLDIIKNDSSTKAARMAAIKLSDLYLKYKMPEDALKTLTIVSASAKSDLTSSLLLFQLANVQAQLGKCNEAVGAWEGLLKNKNASYLHKEAQVRMGLCYEALKDPSKAELMYLEASKKEERSEFGPAKDAEKYLRLLKLKKLDSKGS